MKLRTVVRDCLYLNWALPAAALPDAPAPLRYQLHPWRGGDHVFASALLFHQDSVRFSAVPLLRFGHPQLNLRLYVLDAEGYPSVLFLRMLMPLWMAPGVRLLTRQPAASAHLDFPRPSRAPEEGSWRWRAERGDTLSVRAWLDSPGVGEGPRLGSWEETVRYFNERPRGYAEVGGALHRIDASHRTGAVWPMRAELDGGRLLPKLLPLAGARQGNPANLANLANRANQADPADGAHPATPAHPANTVTPATPQNPVTLEQPAAPEHLEWPPLHSSFLCPEMPFAFSVDLVPSVPVVRHVPHPAAGRVATPAMRADALARAGLGAKTLSSSRASRAARAVARAATGNGAGAGGEADDGPGSEQLRAAREPRQASC